MKHILKRCAIIMLTVLTTACADKNSNAYLNQARDVINNNPEKAYALLNSITAPEKLEKSKYMEYSVLLVQAKLYMGKDVHNDTTIFEAQRYFNAAKDKELTILADYYAASVYRVRNENDKALNALLSAIENAHQVNNNLLLGKSYYNMGYIYYTQNIPDSALVNGLTALKYLKKVKGAWKNLFMATNIIGLAYEAKGDLDSAYNYTNKGLAIANELKDSGCTFDATNNMGLVYLDMKQYDKAADYLHKALRISTNTKDSLIAKLNLAEMYNGKNMPDSAHSYVQYIENRLEHAPSVNALGVIYGLLSKYSIQIGKPEEAARYKLLQANTELKLEQQNMKEDLAGVQNKFMLQLEQEKNRPCPRNHGMGYFYRGFAQCGTRYVLLPQSAKR